jgi:hypothetical protein
VAAANGRAEVLRVLFDAIDDAASPLGASRQALGRAAASARKAKLAYRKLRERSAAAAAAETAAEGKGKALLAEGCTDLKQLRRQVPPPVRCAAAGRLLTVAPRAAGHGG